MNQQDCVFCEIVRGEVLNNIFYSDSRVIVFDDIHPRARVHKLIVPKVHIATLNDVVGEEADAILLHMFKVAQKIAIQLEVAKNGYRTVINCLEGGGQEILHLHLHLLAK